MPEVRRSAYADLDARYYFQALFGGRLPYRLVHQSQYTAILRPPANAYESLGQTVYIFELDPAKVRLAHELAERYPDVERLYDSAKAKKLTTASYGRSALEYYAVFSAIVYLTVLFGDFDCETGRRRPARDNRNIPARAGKRTPPD